jgi:hypothetical protein
MKHQKTLTTWQIKPPPTPSFCQTPGSSNSLNNTDRPSCLHIFALAVYCSWNIIKHHCLNVLQTSQTKHFWNPFSSHATSLTCLLTQITFHIPYLNGTTHFPWPEKPGDNPEYYILVLFPCGAENWTQDLVHTSQALYHWIVSWALLLFLHSLNNQPPIPTIPSSQCCSNTIPPSHFHFLVQAMTTATASKQGCFSLW